MADAGRASGAELELPLAYLRNLPRGPLSEGFEALKLGVPGRAPRSGGRRGRFLKAENQQIDGNAFPPHPVFVKNTSQFRRDLGSGDVTNKSTLQGLMGGSCC